MVVRCELIQADIDAAIAWDKERKAGKGEGGPVSCNCPIAQCMKRLFPNEPRVYVSFRRVSFGDHKVYHLDTAARVVTNLFANEWNTVKPTSFTMEEDDCDTGE